MFPIQQWIFCWDFCQCSLYLWESDYRHYHQTSLQLCQTVFTLRGNSLVVTETSLNDVCCPTCHSIICSKIAWPSWQIVRWNPKLVHLFDSQLNLNANIVPHVAHPLVDESENSEWKLPLYLQLVYCYKSVTEYLQEMLWPDFLEKKVNCGNQERGKIWKEFFYIMVCCFWVFLTTAFQLNVDWFKPFRLTQHSEGAIYLTIMNLPQRNAFCKRTSSW